MWKVVVITGYYANLNISPLPYEGCSALTLSINYANCVAYGVVSIHNDTSSIYGTVCGTVSNATANYIGGYFGYGTAVGYGTAASKGWALVSQYTSCTHFQAPLICIYTVLSSFLSLSYSIYICVYLARGGYCWSFRMFNHLIVLFIYCSFVCVFHFFSSLIVWPVRPSHFNTRFYASGD